MILILVLGFITASILLGIIESTLFFAILEGMNK